jgi:hypothetical protein
MNYYAKMMEKISADYLRTFCATLWMYRDIKIPSPDG